MFFFVIVCSSLFRLVVVVWASAVSGPPARRSADAYQQCLVLIVPVVFALREVQRALIGSGKLWFTKGFDTKDLQEAKALLAELA
jgi:hypothetical protein